MPDLAHRFLAALPEEARRAQPAPAQLEPLLAAAVARGRAAWPAVSLEPTRYVEHLAAVLARGEEPTRLEALHLEDLYLACAAATGERGAIAAAEGSFADEVDRALARSGVTPDLADEVRQRLRAQLFVGDEGSPPQVLAYSGLGRLGAFVRVVAVRIALKWFRGERRHEPLAEGDELAELVDPARLADAGPEQELLRDLYTREFKAALARAAAGLEERERTLLRQHLIEGLTIDDLGALYGVHRATAARWIERARRELIAGLRRILRQQLGVEETTLESVLRLVDSRIDLSVPKLLG